MKKMFAFFAFLCVCSSANAQLNYSNNKLSFGNITFPAGEWHKTAWDGWGHYWGFRTNSGGYTWFKMVLGASNPRLSGSGGYVVFYDTSFQDIYVRNVYNSSDKRAKTNIVPLSGSARSATETVLELYPVSYSFIEPELNKDRSVRRDMGFLAQDVEKVLPEAVVTDPEGNKLINYTTIIPLLTGAIQELNARISELEAQLNTQRK